MYKVMLIDDEKSLHMAIEKLLTKSGYEYCGATDAESGLEMLAVESLTCCFWTSCCRA